jgi:Ca2+-binding RTX toxin-like protein
MSGGDGNDTYVVDNTGDLITDRSGIDLVEASVSFTLARSIENLTLTGPDAISGTGHVGANVIIGNGAANVLSGRGGFDQLTGGGADTFVMASTIKDSINLAAITDFNTAADRIALDTRFFANVGTAGTLDARSFTDGVPTTSDQRVVYDAGSGDAVL